MARFLQAKGQFPTPFILPSIFGRGLPKENNWDSQKRFDVHGQDFTENELFILRTNFRDRALSTVKEKINVDKNKREKGTRIVTTTCMNSK